MIVLKDIKVSKTRIPVQNALWLRPVDKETYKIYYPSGGNWKEVVFETSEDMDNTLEPRVEALEKAMKQVNVDISEIKRDFEEFETDYYRDKSQEGARFNNLENRVTALENSFDTIISLVESQITSVILPDDFWQAANSGRSYSRSKMADFGFNELVFRSIYDGYCTKAYINGDEYAITTEDLDPEPADIKPGYGGKIIFTGEESVDAETEIVHHTEYTVTPDVYVDSVDDTIEIWEYEITVREVYSTGEDSYLVGTLKTNSSKKAYVAKSNFDTIFNGSTHVYSDPELTTPAVSGEYSGESVEVEDPTSEEPVYAIVNDFIVANGIITEELEPEPLDPEEPEEPVDPEDPNDP